MFWSQCLLLLILKMLEAKFKDDHMNNIELPLYNPHCFLVNFGAFTFLCLWKFYSLQFAIVSCYVQLQCSFTQFTFIRFLSCISFSHQNSFAQFTFFFKHKKHPFLYLPHEYCHMLWIFGLDNQCLIKF